MKTEDVEWFGGKMVGIAFNVVWDKVVRWKGGEGRVGSELGWTGGGKPPWFCWFQVWERRVNSGSGLAVLGGQTGV